MAKFAIPVATLRDNELVQFAAGDEVPEWAEDIVGDHCLVLDAEELEELEAKVQPQVEPETPAEDAPPANVQLEVEPETEDEDEVPAAADNAVPDFTKPRTRAARTSATRK